MIALIIKSYLSILLSVGFGSLLLFTVGMYFIFSKIGKTPAKFSSHPVKSAIIVPKLSAADMQNISGIAGGDVISTKLDLARALIEVGNQNSAKAILKSVVKHGNAAQQQEAQRLTQTI